MLGLSKDKLLQHISQTVTLPKPYNIDQIFDGLYKSGHLDFQHMTNLPLATRKELSQLDIGAPKSIEHLISNDGTQKWLLESNQKRYETVFIPQVAQNTQVGTVCVSSQFGCSLNCSFCHTGTQKFQGNLTFQEIVGQIMHCMRSLGDLPSTGKRNVTNVVFMGQGEPLYNFKNVSQAILFVNQTFGLAPWRTTVSTSGVVPLMGKIGSELKASLAVSLHAVTNNLRDELVPLNKMYPIEELMKGCKDYLQAVQSKPLQRITFEYVMLDSVNDSVAEARQLCRLLHGVPAHVNLIPFNPWKGSKYSSSSKTTILKFQKTVESKGIKCHIRTARGQDIMAACGQL
ncbi:putative Fe-S containing enzyme, partial [Gorgonomyces haynaldii]